jgi:hypothetical protein
VKYLTHNGSTALIHNDHGSSWPPKRPKSAHFPGEKIHRYYTNREDKMAFDPVVAPVSLEQVRAKQREFVEVLERQIGRCGNTAVDLYAIANEVDIVPILAVEFLYYWIGMGRLHRSWADIAKRMQEEIELPKGPLKPPAGMLATQSAANRRGKRIPDQRQQRVYAELWQDIVAIIDTRHTSQMPFSDRDEGKRFHHSQMGPAFDAIEKVDRVSAYLSGEHYEAIRGYFNTFCNYHLYRAEKYSNLKEKNPHGWDEQDALLYGNIFGRGQLEITQVFRDILAGQDVPDAPHFSFGSLNAYFKEVTMARTVISGTVTGSVLNLDSTLTDVTQNIGTLQHADQATRDELQKLVADLFDQLKTVPTEHQEMADAVAAQTKDVVEKAKQDAPNKPLLQMAVSGLKAGAETLKTVAPSVVSIVTSLAGIISKLHGL